MSTEEKTQKTAKLRSEGSMLRPCRKKKKFWIRGGLLNTAPYSKPSYDLTHVSFSDSPPRINTLSPQACLQQSDLSPQSPAIQAPPADAADNRKPTDTKQETSRRYVNLDVCSEGSA